MLFASPQAGPNAADLAAAEAWVVLHRSPTGPRPPPAGGRPISGGNIAGYSGVGAGGMSPSTYTAAAKAYAGRSSPAQPSPGVAGFTGPPAAPSGAAAPVRGPRRDLQRELAYVESELAALEKAPMPSPGGSGGRSMAGGAVGRPPIPHRSPSGATGAAHLSPSSKLNGGGVVPTDDAEQAEMLRMLDSVQQMQTRLTHGGSR